MNNTRPPMPTVPPVGLPGGQPTPSPAEPPMRDRIARGKTLLRRGLGYWKVSLALFVVVGGLAFLMAKSAVRTYRAECVLEVRGGSVRSEGEAPGSTTTADRLTSMVQSRDTLEEAIKKFDLFPKTVENRSLKDAADEMRPSVGVRSGKGGLYTLGFQLNETDGREPRALVRDVTQFLGESLVQDWTSSFQTDFLKDKQEKAKQLEADVADAQNHIDDVTKKLTVFVMNHPQYQDIANKASTGNPFGFPVNPLIEVPTPKQLPKDTGNAKVNEPSVDPELQKIYQQDLKLSGLWREKQLLEAQLKPTTPGAPPTVVTPVTSVADLTKQVETAQAELDAAQAAFKERDADFQNKAATLGVEHYDYKTAQAARNAAAATLQEKRTKLAALQQALKVAQNPAAPPTSTAGTDPYSGAAVNAELVTHLKEVNGEISARMEALKAQFQKTGTAPTATPSASTAPTIPAPALTTLTPQQRREKEIVDNEVVYRSLINELKGWKDKADTYSKDLETTRSAVRDAQRSAGNLISIKEPPVAPLQPYSSKRMIYFMAGMALAFLLALLYPAARVAMNDTIIDAQDVEGLHLIPVLGVVPKIQMTTSPSTKDQSGPAAAANRGATGAV